LKFSRSEIEFSTSKRFELVDITHRVEEFVRESGIRNGILLVYAPHATGSIIVNEAEHGLMNDILEKVKEFTEPGSSKWRHNLIDDNAHAHIGSALFGHERVFPIIDGRIVKGTWQNVFFLEMDGPRSRRKIVLVAIGE